MKVYENDCDPWSLTPFSDKDEVFEVNCNGHCWRFNPENFMRYIVETGRTDNPYNSQPLSLPDLQHLNRLCQTLHKAGKLKEEPPNLLQYANGNSKDQHKMSMELEFALENECRNLLKKIVICCKFYDDEVALPSLQEDLLPELQSTLLDLHTHNSNCTRTMLNEAYDKLMYPYREKQFRKPNRCFIEALVYLQQLEDMLAPSASHVLSNAAGCFSL